MSIGDSVPARLPWRLAVGVFLIAFAAYLLTHGGHDYTSDGAQTYYTAENFLLRGTLTIDERGAGLGAVRGRDGHYFMVYPPGQSIAEAPVLAAFHAVTSVLGLEAEAASKLMRIWVPSVTNSILATSLLLVIVTVLMRMGYRIRTALLVSAVIGWTTPLWPYAKYDFAEPLQGLLLAALFLQVISATPADARCRIAISGLIAGASLLAKSVFLLFAPLIFLALLFKTKTKSVRDIAIAAILFGVPVVTFGLIYLGWNYFRFGTVSEYGVAFGFSTPLWMGLYSYLFSSGKSVFLYAPVLIVSLMFARRFWHAHRFEAVVLVLISVPVVIPHALYWAWHGDWSWAPRYLVPLIPLWCMPIVIALVRGTRAEKAGLGIAVAAGLAVSFVGASINPGNYLNLVTFQTVPKSPDGNANMTLAQEYVHYVPDFSPVVGHAWLTAATIEKSLTGRGHTENEILQAWPWRSRLPQWRPPHPEYLTFWDYWVVDTFNTEARFYFLLLVVTLMALGAGSIAWGLGLLRRSAAT